MTPTDLRKRLGQILDAASAGERILIERDHRPVAMLVSPEDGGRLDESAEAVVQRRLAALERLEAMARRDARDFPRRPRDPDAATAVRLDRDRDDARGGG